MKTIGVLTSGGDSPGMNAAIRAIVKVGAARGTRIIGFLDGYEGLIDGRFRELTHLDGTSTRVADDEVDSAVALGGTVLGTARSSRFRELEGRKTALKNAAFLDGLIVIGGNGSLAGSHLLAAERRLQVMGVPASIDNDIGCTGTSIGVDTALNTIVDACDRISDTARSHRRAFIVEVMGRQSGYLAIASAIAAGAEAVLFREQGRDERAIVGSVANLIRRLFSSGHRRRVLVIKSEGIEIPCTRLVREVQLELKDLSQVEIRATVLGHIVRGGRPSYHDRMIAGRLGLAALNALYDGGSDEMVGWNSPVTGGTSTGDPQVMRFPLAKVLQETESLLDGSSVVSQWRVKIMENLEGILPL